MRKQFDLNYYLEHPETRVVTRDERSVRIHCTDLKNKRYPIVASFIDLYDESEEVETYTRNGKCIAGEYNTSDKDTDLFFELPEPEKKRVPLTYEDLLQRVKEGKTMWIGTRSEVKQIVEFDINGFTYASNEELNTKPYFVMTEYDIHFVDGTPCWKEVEE